MRFSKTILIGALLAAGATAAPATAGDRQSRAEAKLAKALDGRVAGEPVDCITQHSIRSSTIIDGTAILYRIGSKIYVNRPESGASSLDDGKILVTKTHSSRLCDIDTVRLVDRSTHTPMGFVSLGKFVPYTRTAAND